MKEELVTSGGSPPEPVRNEYTYNNTGPGSLIAHTDTYNKQLNLVVLDVNGRRTTANSDFYSLIIGIDPFESDHFTMAEDRTLTEYISEDMANKFLPITAESVAEMKLRPLLIAQECAKVCASAQDCAIGFIRDIQKRETGYEVYFRAPFTASMEIVWENMYALGITHQFELTRTHWTLKQIDLFEVLKDAGFDWFQSLGG